jgi:histone deacetylase 1/2
METWELVSPPPGANILGSKWVFALKTKPDGSLDRFKARLVVQGFGQKEGVDYDDTFASTAGKTTVRIFFAMICCK